MLDHVITGGLIWFGLGSAIWAACDPARFNAFILRWYIDRYRRLPGQSFVVAAHLASMLASPLLVVIAVVKAHRRVWHG